MFPFLFVLWEQQESMLALVILIGCWFALRNHRDILAGLILGLALFRFQIAIPLALVLAFWRPRLLKGFIVSGTAVLSISLAMVRPAGMIAYWRYLVGMTSASYTTVNTYHMNPTGNVALRGLIYELLRGSDIGTHGLIAAVTVVLGVLIVGVAWRFMRINTLHNEIKFSFALISALLLSFHLLPHDLILLSLPFVLLAGSMARWPLAVLYVASLPWVFGFPNQTAWFALVPVSSLAAMAVLYLGNSTDPRHHVLPPCLRLQRVPLPDAEPITLTESTASAVAHTTDVYSAPSRTGR
jgi:hypothetical protein